MRFSCFDDVINKMFAFLTNKVLFFSYISYILLFDSDQQKVCYLCNTTKNKVICNSESIYIYIGRFLLTELVVLLTF